MYECTIFSRWEKSKYYRYRFILPVISVYLLFFAILWGSFAFFIPEEKEKTVLLYKVLVAIKYIILPVKTTTLHYSYYLLHNIKKYIKYLDFISLITQCGGPGYFLLVHFAKWVEYKLCVCNVMCVQCKFVWWSCRGGGGGNLDDDVGISRFAWKFSTISSSLFPK